jgi:N-acetylmuramoyl-L-alanine amidase
MCDLCLPRRAVLGGLGTVAVAGLLGPIVPTPAGAQQPAIVRRSQWGPQLAPTGPIVAEPDVRFLLVHHTVNANTYAAADVVGLLGAIYSFHTGPERGWPDVAYNFFVDRFGTVYEGRTGSLAGAVAGDASGGSQGFAQLCAFIGDHSSVPPSDAAQASMAGLLGFLGSRHGLDLSPGATATFSSRGSNRHPAGASVTTATISGHRDMSTTACPGDAAYAMVADGTFARLASGGGQPAPPTTAPPPPPPPPPPTTTTSSTTTSTSTTSTSTTSTSTSTSTTSTLPATTIPVPTSPSGSEGSGTAPLAVTGAAVVVAAAGAVVALRRRTGTEPELESGAPEGSDTE